MKKVEIQYCLTVKHECKCLTEYKGPVVLLETGKESRYQNGNDNETVYYMGTDSMSNINWRSYYSVKILLDHSFQS